MLIVKRRVEFESTASAKVAPSAVRMESKTGESVRRVYLLIRSCICQVVLLCSAAARLIAGHRNQENSLTRNSTGYAREIY